MKLKKIIKILIVIVIILPIFYLSYYVKLDNININFLNLITFKFNNYKINDYKIDFIDLYISSLKKKEHFILNNNKLEGNNLSSEEVIVYNDKTEEPLIYIYNTHTNEEYNYTKNDIYNIVPTVKTASYILQSELLKLGINSVVESENTFNILKERNLLSRDSYKISREYLEKGKKENPSLVYFIDLHRDSVKNTSITIDNVDYAKILFVLGLENNNYKENKEVMTKLNNYFNLNYAGLSKGIYEKKGSGVNGVYNQDFSSNTMLIEIGGVENNLLEVSNTLKVVASGIYNLINS